VLGAAGIGLAGIAALAVVAPWIGLGLALVPWVSAVVFAGVMATVLCAIGGSHPFTRFGPANHVTTARVGLLAVTAGLAAAPPSAAGAWTAAAATLAFAALDGLDGFVARRTRMSSPFGARFDMETDALFILVLSLLVWRHDKAGAWVVTSGMMRYAFGAAGRLLPWMARPLRSTRRGKAVAALQVVALGAAAAPIVPTRASSAMAAAALAALTWSFAIDIRYLWRRRQDAGI
jgi:phosphatidylglycerophosphate synthase